jgi:hypothetical protein
MDGLKEMGSGLVEPSGSLVVAERAGERIELLEAESGSEKALGVW